MASEFVVKGVSPRPSRAREVGLAIVLAGLGLFCFRGVTELAYTGVDAPPWVSSCRLDTAEGRHYVFGQEHFIGYRPVTALSYALGRAVHGVEPLGYQIVDLAFHGACLVLLYIWLRSLGVGMRATSFGVLVLAFHPVTLEVVPVLARRGDLLVTAWSLLALIAAIRPRGAILATMATAAALLSKETAAPLAFLIFAVVWLRAGDLGGIPRMAYALRRAWGPLAATVAVALLRYAVIGSFLGGYPDDGEGEGNRLGLIGDFFLGLTTPFCGVFFPGHPIGEEPGGLVFGVMVGLAAIVPAAFILGATFSTKGVRGSALSVAGLWLTAQLFLYIVSGRFESRLLYPSLVPLALGVAALLETNGGKAERGTLAKYLSRFSMVGLLVFWATQGPLVRGCGEWTEASRLQREWISSLMESMDQYPEAELFLVVNYPYGVWSGPDQRRPSFRADAFFGMRDVTLPVGLSSTEDLLKIKGRTFKRTIPLSYVIVREPKLRLQGTRREDGEFVVLAQVRDAYWGFAGHHFNNNKFGDLNVPVTLGPELVRLLPVPKTVVVRFDLEGAEAFPLPGPMRIEFDAP